MPTDRVPPRFPTFAKVEDERRHRKQRSPLPSACSGSWASTKGSRGTSPRATPSCSTTSG